MLQTQTVVCLFVWDSAYVCVGAYSVCFDLLIKLCVFRLFVNLPPTTSHCLLWNTHIRRTFCQQRANWIRLRIDLCCEIFLNHKNLFSQGKSSYFHWNFTCRQQCLYLLHAKLCIHFWNDRWKNNCIKKLTWKIYWKLCFIHASQWE